MKLLKTFFLLLSLLIVTLLFRAMYYAPVVTEGSGENVIPNLTINDKTAIQHFARALTFKTISSEVPTDNYSQQFEQFHIFLKRTYPEIFSKFKITKIGQHAILMKWQGTDKSLEPVLFMGHQDVVPIAPGTEDAWQHAPFKGDVADGYVWGRGALDDKASLMGIFEATNLLLKNHFTPKRTIYFYFGDDEENLGKSAAIASKLLQKQGVHFAYVLDEGSIIADGIFPQVAGKIALIGVTEKGFLDLKLSVNTEGGHSSMPPKVTAIGEVSQAIVNILKHPFPEHLDSVTTQMFETLAGHMQFRNRLVMSNIWLFKPYILHQLAQDPMMNALIRTTQAPTIFNAGIKSNVLPSNSSAIVNFRIIPGDTVTSTIEHVKAAINNPSVKIEPISDISAPSPVSSTTAFGYQLIAQVSKQLYGENLLIAPYMLEGATDSRYFVPVADNVYRFFPIALEKSDMLRFHGIDERYAIEGYLKLVRFYSAMLAAT